MTTQAPTSPAQDSPEVTSRPARQWTTAQRLAILDEYEAFPKNDPRRGALLRRHGLYSSHITRWRKQRDRGVLGNEAAPTAGRPPQPRDPQQDEIARLTQEVARLQGQLQQAEAIMDIPRNLPRNGLNRQL
jgi:transposase